MKFLLVSVSLAVAVVVAVFTVVPRSDEVAHATFASSENVALVPGPCGAFGGAGCMPTTGFSGGYSPSFTSVETSTLPSVIAGYDTVVLLQICDIGTYLADASWRDALHNWINAGGKLVIYDSDACGSITLDYSNFIFPFTTNNPCQCGSSQGTLEIVEDNTLGSSASSSSYYIDVLSTQQNTDAVGDASVMLTQDSHWKGHMRAENVLGAQGFTHTYAEHGSGLIIYNGLDSDYVSSDAGLQKLWELELKQQWDPSDLPGSVPVAPVACSAPYAFGVTRTTRNANPSNVLAAIDQGFSVVRDLAADQQTGLMTLRTFLLGGKQGSINLIVDDPATKPPSRFLETRAALGCDFTPGFTGDAEIVARFRFRPGTKAAAAAGSAAALPELETFLKPALEHYYTQATGRQIDSAVRKYSTAAELFRNLLGIAVNFQKVHVVDEAFVESYAGSESAARAETNVNEIGAIFWSGPLSQTADLGGQEFTVTLVKHVTEGEREFLTAGIDTNVKAWGWAGAVENFADGIELVDIKVNPE